MSSYSSASVTTVTAQFTTASAKLLAAEPHFILDLIEAQCDASVGDLRCEGTVLEHVEPVMGRLQLIEFKFFELLALKNMHNSVRRECLGDRRHRGRFQPALHFQSLDQAEASRTVGGSATPAARIARLAAGRGAERTVKRLASCPISVAVSESRSAMISGQEPERPSAAMRSSSAFFSRPADLGVT
jgi:hypothetical protein